MIWVTKHKKLLLICTTLLLIVGWLVFLRFSTYRGKGLWPLYRTKEMTIEGKTYRLVIADTPERWEQGLMYVRKPTRTFDGMVFIFPEPEPLTFWNQNTYEDLMLYWMNNGEVVGKSELPSIEKSKEIVTVKSPRPADTVVEIIK